VINRRNEKDVPRPRADRIYAEPIPNWVEEGHGPSEIHERLIHIAERAGREDVPSMRWVYDQIKRHKDQPTDVRRQAAFYRWPRSHHGETKALPWDAAPAALELMRYRDERGLERPTVRQVFWYWRVKQAAPDIPAYMAFVLSAQLSSGDPSGVAIEGQLTYRPWGSTEAGAAYRRAWTRPVAPLPQPWEAPDGDDYGRDYKPEDKWLTRYDWAGPRAADDFAEIEAASQSGGDGAASQALLRHRDRDLAEKEKRDAEAR
jgi:hypothetical protein